MSDWVLQCLCNQWGLELDSHEILILWPMMSFKFSFSFVKLKV